MSKPIFLLLGGNKLNYGIQLKFQKKGYLVFVIDWNEKPSLTGDRHYQIDVKEPYKIIEALKKDNVWENTAFAYTSIDLAVKSVAIINREIGLATISEEGLAHTTSKSMMTKIWNEAGLLNRISKAYTEYDPEIEVLDQQMNIIIKPDNSASSRGITVVERGSSEQTIRAAFEKALKEATDNIVVVEECVDGIEFTVDMLGDSYGNVSVYGISKKYHTSNTINNRIAVKLHYNSVDDKLQEKIANVGIACYKALGFSASLGHLEILLKDDGTLSPVEIGARSSGFIASDLVDIVSGADYLGDLVDVQNGAKIENGLHRQTDRSSMYFFYDMPEGLKVEEPYTLKDFLNTEITSRYSDTAGISKNRIFTKIDNDNARIGYEVLEGNRDLLTYDYIVSCENRMLKSIGTGIKE